MLEFSISPELKAILSALQAADGEPLFVGGFVRDLLLGHVSKDVDIEVYGLSSEALLAALAPFGWVEGVGASFGVIKLRTRTAEYDFSLPRRENKRGRGHKGFSVEVDPSMTPRAAASRRDFTVNALALRPDGTLLDFYGGEADLKAGRLRHVSDKFAEDPLRVLRAFQFAARFDFGLDQETAALAKSLKGEYANLSKERVWAEWHKWARRAIKPGRGFDVLAQTGWLEFYPELAALVGLPQDPEWHPEGDVFTHTGHVCDSAAEIAVREGLSSERRTVLLFSALCHDLGKAVTTVRENNRWVSPRHAPEGVPLTERLLTRIHAPRALIDRVKPLVKEHMSHLNELNPRAVRRLALRLEPSTIASLALVIEADASGRPPLPKGLPPSAQRMLTLAQALALQQAAPQPLLLGRHLLDLAEQGRLPAEYAQGGAHFSRLLNKVFQAQLDGEFDTLEGAKSYAISLA